MMTMRETERFIEIENRLDKIEKELKVLQPVEEFKKGEVVYCWDELGTGVLVGFYNSQLGDEMSLYKHSGFLNKRLQASNSPTSFINCSHTNPLLESECTH